jgi:hypothetical protein
MSFEVTVTPTVYNVEVEVNPSVQPFDVVVEVGNVPDLDLTTNGDSGASTFDPLTGELNIPEYTLDGLGGVPESRTLTINGTTQDLSANRTFTIATATPVTIGSPANGLSVTSGQVLSIGLASGSADGALSSADWTTFNGKQNALGFTAENVANKAINLVSPDDTKYPTTLAVSTALAGKQDTLTNPITGTGASGQVAFFNGTSSQTGSNNLFWDNANGRLGIGGSPGAFSLDVNGTARIGNIRLLNTLDTLEFANTLVRIRRAANRMTFDGFDGFEWVDSNASVTRMRIFGSTGNVLLQNGGTFTDAGFRLDVNGTARVQGAITGTSTLILGSTGNAGTINLNRSSTGGQIASITGLTNGVEILSIAKILIGLSDIDLSSATGVGSNSLVRMKIFGVSGNIHVQPSGGTYTDIASSALSVNSTTQGFLPPRLTTTQRDAIASPATGLVVYNTTDNLLSFYNGTAWTNL